jgi:glycosyltransferase involved in cell wall biosynthesis
VLVDGASIDNTDEVINEFAEDKRLKYIKLEKNLSFKETYKIAVNNTNGKYLTFLDSDDEYLPTKIEKQIALIETLPEDYGMVYCWMNVYDDNTKKKIRIYKSELKGYVGNDVVDKARVSGTPSFMLKKNIFLEMGGWNYDIGIISDWEFGARLCQKWKVDYVPEFLVNIFENHGHVRMSELNDYYKDYYKRDIIFRNYFLTEFKNVFDKYPRKALKRHYLYLMNSYIRSHRFKEFFKCIGEALIILVFNKNPR